MFFASHYSESWFETWNYKWYTGFTITSYPPLVHQMMALFSKFIGLKLAFVSWGFIIVAIFIRGVFNFSKLFVHEKAAVYAAFAAVFSFSFVEALHVFGQLPSITGIAFVLNACPEVYKFFRYKKRFYFLAGISLLAVTTAAHHVSTIFGAVFFIAPIIGMAIVDRCADKYGGINSFGLKAFLKEVRLNLPAAITFGLVLISVVLFVVFPYWYWSKTDPISQVPIPHGSRENFLQDHNLGMVFFLIPWGFLAFILPYFFIKLYNRRNIFLGLSFTLAFILGTGGTTPIPKMILGENAFNILTLDRFTFWASLMALPFWGLFIYELFEGELRAKILSYMGSVYHKIALGTFSMLLILSCTLIVNLNYFRPLQPDKIDIDPIVKFLSTDDHNNWRYLTLGFGDQVAWLSANVDALSVDGNYHSARRLPEMTTRPVERLENSKYLGMSGLGALQQFLTVPEKYHLKYIFSNDKFYDPLLYFSGWEKIGPLENGIKVWEKPDVDPLPGLLPKKTIPKVQALIWGLVPISCFIFMMLINILGRSIYKWDTEQILDADFENTKESFFIKYKWWLTGLFFISTLGSFLFAVSKKYLENKEHDTPNSVVTAYYDHLDFRNFKHAHQLLAPDSKPAFEQFMLERNIEDGLLASFAKLDSLEIFRSEELNDSLVHVHAKAHWITSIMAYSSDHVHICKKLNGKWFVKHQAYEKKTPPDKFFSLPHVEFRSQGRRTAEVDKTDKRDILDRPRIYVMQSRLMKQDSSYYIIGDLINTDDVPAYLSINAILFDEKGEELLRYNARDVLQHHLLPKEKTSFKISFEEIAWQKNFQELPEKFDPDYTNPFDFSTKPVSFKIFIKSLASDKSSYKYIGLQNLSCIEDEVSGSIYNYGTDQINIPLLISSWYDEDGKLIWVDRHYQSKGIRPQRMKDFKIGYPKNKISHVLEGDDKSVLVNGILNGHYKPPMQEDLDFDMLKTKSRSFPFTSIHVNSFVDQ